MITLDGRTDLEKLHELLRFPENTHLEFKQSVDLSTKPGKATFAKDVIALSNRPPGGYFLVGVDDEGRPCAPNGTLGDPQQFDSARLGSMVRSYVDAQVEIISQVHVVNGHEIAVLFIKSSKEGLPIPMNKNAQPAGASGDRMIFRQGDVFVREGAQIVPLRYAHWAELLSERDARIRAEGRALGDELLTEILSEFKASGSAGNRAIQINTDMDVATFTSAIESHFENASNIPLTRVIRTLSSKITQDDEHLVKLAIIATHALYYDSDQVFETVLDELERRYNQLEHYVDDSTRKQVTVLLYVIGSCAVRLEKWRAVPSLVNRPIHLENDFMYSSWIRHAQVQATRANLLGGKYFVLSEARETLVTFPGLHPDIEEVEPAQGSELPKNDIINSLCHFDFLYCLVSAIHDPRDGGYPASSWLNQSRTDPIILELARSESLRRQLFGDASDKEIAETLTVVYQLASKESRANGTWGWFELPPPVVDFIRAQGVPERV